VKLETHLYRIAAFQRPRRTQHGPRHAVLEGAAFWPCNLRSCAPGLNFRPQLSSVRRAADRNLSPHPAPLLSRCAGEGGYKSWFATLLVQSTFIQM
jgi:hypothetical protein